MKLKHLGLIEYADALQQAKDFTVSRTSTTEDELWICQHLPVFTQGGAERAGNLLNETSIPILETDRGGQITYHGPGQLSVHVLIDLSRCHYRIRGLIDRLERSICQTLANWNIVGTTLPEAPGVYVPFVGTSTGIFEGKAKISSIGLKLKEKKTYHGLALNVDMDLNPFSLIKPCGYENLQMVDMKTLNQNTNIDEVVEFLSQRLLVNLSKGNDFERDLH